MPKLDQNVNGGSRRSDAMDTRWPSATVVTVGSVSLLVTHNPVTQWLRERWLTAHYAWPITDENI